MAILPIDIQTLLGQMNNAGRIQHNIETSPINQQMHQGNIIHHQAVQKDNQVINLEQTDNEDKKLNPDEEKENNTPNQNRKGADEERFKESNDMSHEFYKDPNKGNLIDVKK